MNTELYLRYLELKDAYKGYMHDNFAEDCWVENDYEAQWLDHRIGFAMWCMINEKPIPESCALKILVEEFEGLIEYRES